MTKKVNVRTSVAIIAVLLGVGVAVVSSRADSYVSAKIATLVQSATSGKYQVKHDNPDVRFFPPAVALNNLQLFSNDSTYIHIHDSLLLLPHFTAERIEFSGLGLLALLFSDEVRIDDVSIERPNITLAMLTTQTDSTRSATRSATRSVTLKSEADNSDSLTFYVGSLGISNGRFEWVRNGRKVFETNFDAGGNDLGFGGFEDFPLEADTSTVRLFEATFYTEGGVTAVGTDTTAFSFPSGELAFSGVRIYSLYDKYELSEIKGHQVDWLSMEIRQINAKIANPKRAFGDGVVKIPLLEIEGFNGHVFKDKRWPFPDRADRPMPYQMLRQIPFTLIIDTTVLTQSEVVYEEYAEKGNEPGHVSFKELEAKITPIRNDSAVVATMEATALVMGEGRLDALFKIPLQQGAGQHVTYGTLGKIEMKSLNTILQHSAGVTIESGVVDKLEFEFTYDDDKSDGEARFAYSGLKVKLLDRQGNGFVSDIGEDIGTWLVNSFVAKTDNSPGEKFRTGKIAAERNRKKSIFNYWWESLFSGLKSSITPGEKKD